MLPENQIERIPGTDVYDPDGAKIGRAGTVYLDDDTGRPEWATVNTGLFGTRESFVPISEAELQGDRLTVPYRKDQVKDAPNVDPEGGHLSRQEERRLYDHYGLSSAERDAYGRRRGEVGHENPRGEANDAMTRSEERLNVGTRQQEVRLEHEPVTEGERTTERRDADLSEEEMEVTLHQERPVVEKEAVPVERVRLAKTTVTDEETVSGEVRKEQINAEGLDETRDG